MCLLSFSPKKEKYCFLRRIFASLFSRDFHPLSLALILTRRLKKEQKGMDDLCWSGNLIRKKILKNSNVFFLNLKRSLYRLQFCKGIMMDIS